MKLNEYKFNKKLKEIGILSWDLLIWFSKITIFLFFLITALMFWQNLSIELVKEYQVNLAKPISKMIFIVLISVILSGINIVKKLIK
jgi:uncharacterized membrane protein YcgQ (UPF0703/DUF1980 family)